MCCHINRLDMTYWTANVLIGRRTMAGKSARIAKQMCGRRGPFTEVRGSGLQSDDMTILVVTMALIDIINLGHPST